MRALSKCLQMSYWIKPKFWHKIYILQLTNISLFVRCNYNFLLYTPVLSAQLMTAPTGNAREIRNFPPAEPPRPESQGKGIKSWTVHKLHPQFTVSLSDTALLYLIVCVYILKFNCESIQGHIHSWSITTLLLLQFFNMQELRNINAVEVKIKGTKMELSFISFNYWV